RLRTSFFTSSANQSVASVGPSSPPISAITPADENALPKTLAARRTRRSSTCSASSRACTMAITVLGSASPFPPVTARTSSSRKNGLPSARSTTRATRSSVAASPSASRTSRADAFFVSGGSRSSVKLRSLHRLGKSACTSGRASASVMKGPAARWRSAASTSVTLATSPQWRSSSTSSKGRRLVSAARRRELQVARVGERRADDLPEERGDAPHVLRRHGARDPGEQPLLGVGEGLAAPAAGRAPDGLGDHPERRPRAHGIAAAGPHLALVGDQAPELVAHPALAGARGGGDEHHARDPVVDALAPRRLERGELALAADAGRRPPQQRPPG